MQISRKRIQLIKSKCYYSLKLSSYKRNKNSDALIIWSQNSWVWDWWVQSTRSKKTHRAEQKLNKAINIQFYYWNSFHPAMKIYHSLSALIIEMFGKQLLASRQAIEKCEKRSSFPCIIIELHHQTSPNIKQRPQQRFSRIFLALRFWNEFLHFARFTFKVTNESP